MSATWGEKIKITVFGESHGNAVGVTIDGFPAGEKIDFDTVNKMILRRKTNRNEFSSQRNEPDTPEIISGVTNGITNGFPITAVFKNNDAHSNDYNLDILRPGHADYTAYIKFGGHADMRGGGNFSGRLTLPVVFAGAICMQYLNSIGIEISAHALKIRNIDDDKFDSLNIPEELISLLKEKDYPIINDNKLNDMLSEIKKAKEDKNSVGGVIECAITGMKAGVGSPMFEGVESVISSILFSVPAVKGVEFGAGFNASLMYGAECNDEMYCENGTIKFKSNNNGGINGGITNGNPIIFKTAIRPTPTISKPQNTVNIKTNKNEVISAKGRHDPCIVFRAVPVIEAAAAIAVMGLI